ncbi:MAG: GNAT family N-acetyltransferase [Planctomycetaceae bacterium]|nr:GNAT family N-acetyltransferase [Planctomycetaceae bacterium]
MIVPLTQSPFGRPRASSDAPGNLWLRRLGADQAAAALDVWEILETRSSDASLASSRLWTSTWLRHYGDLVPHEFLIGEVEGTPHGACLLTRGVGASIGPFPLRSIHLGTAGEPETDSVCVEYNRLLADDAHRADFLRAIVARVQQESDWDQLQFDGFSQSDADEWLPIIPGASIRRRPSPYFDLRRTRDEGADVLSHLGRSTRSNLRRRLRDYGDLTLDWAESLNSAEEIFSELVTLHQARWTAAGRPGAFASSRFHDFQLELMTRGLLDRRIVMFRVRQGRQTIGCLFLLVDRNRLLDYISGFASFDAYASPGLVVHALCMQEALRRGYDAYDFLVGEHQHKRNLSNAENELLWVVWRRDRLKFRLAGLVREAKQIVRWARRRDAAS